MVRSSRVRTPRFRLGNRGSTLRTTKLVKDKKIIKWQIINQL
jgi:hypothetical protein